MSLQPLQPYEFLSWMALPDHRGIYILGSFARRVTIYSQQMRAYNLIDALCQLGRLQQGTIVAVIGGGAAGLTAAAAAAVRGAKVAVLERAPELLRLQRNCLKRYVHPHIYDWPAEGSLTAQAAFPLLGWKATMANEMAASILTGWAKVANQFDISVWDSVEGLDIVPQLSGVSVQVRWERARPQKVSSDVRSLDCDILILAIGFGEEADAPGSRSYWGGEDIDFVPLRRKKWLVSGQGDGGLTDLIRLCIPNFAHRTILKFAEDKLAEPYRDQLLIAEREHASDLRVMRDVYLRAAKAYLEDARQAYANGAHPPPLIGDKDALRQVYFNARSNFYSPTSSALNRFIVAQLEVDQRFELRTDTYVRHEFDHAQNYHVTFKREDQQVTQEVFDEIVLRHGPKRPSIAQDFPAIWRASAPLRERWQRQLPHLDRTLIQTWKPAAYRLRNIPQIKTPDAQLLKQPRHGDAPLRCVVVLSNHRVGPRKLDEEIESALYAKRQDIRALTGREFEQRVERLRVNTVLANPKTYTAGVRKLCGADIAVFDITQFEPGIMLLLGMRSAVRRGVTLVITQEPLTDEQWAKLPFNLKELNPIQTLGDAFRPALRSFVESGLEKLNTLAYYLDLPTYDALRQLGLNARDYAPLSPEEQVLVLCPFDGDYLKANWKFVGDAINDGFGGAGGDVAKRVLDLPSPQLVNQRLYGAIRRTSMCVIDWTGWSDNVFFELGVRLAVNDIGPICIIDDNAPADPPPPPYHEAKMHQRRQLRKLFDPMPYNMRRDRAAEWSLKLRQQFEARAEDRARATTAGASGHGQFPLAHNHTFHLVAHLVPLDPLPGPETVAEELLQKANALVGSDPQQAGQMPVLFTQNPDVVHQTIAQATAYLKTAWSSLDTLDRAAKRDPRQRQLRARLGIRLIYLLSLSVDPSDQKLSERIAKEVERLEIDADVFTQVSFLKYRAQAYRRKQDFAKAEAYLEEALSKLQQDPSGQFRDVATLQTVHYRNAAEQADCYGIRGGTRRDMADNPDKLLEAASDYDLGYDLEQSNRYRIESTYNCLNRLIVRVLIDPRVLEPEYAGDPVPPNPDAPRPPTHVLTELNRAAEILDTHLKDKRRNDPWALADLAMVHALSGNQPQVEVAWIRFDNTNPSRAICQSALKPLEQLAQREELRAQVKEALQVTIRHLRERLARDALSPR